ncbi:hypothetical protein TWF281_002227 [Arthrobotrys megalospora]
MTPQILESLPVDIKFLILSSLNDVRSLYSLCEASPGFASVYDSHQSFIERRVYAHDALAHYRREALWLAVYREKLYKYQPSSLEILQSLAEYKSYPEYPTQETLVYEMKLVPPNDLLRRDNIVLGRNGFQPKRKSYAELLIREKELDLVAKNHKFIFQIYQRFVNIELLKKHTASLSYLRPIPSNKLSRNFDAATEEEERRIVAALYRLLLLVNLFPHINNSVGELRQGWGFWENIHIRAVRDFLVDDIGSFVKSITGKDGMEWIDPSTKYGDTFCLLLLHEFPNCLSSGVDGLWSAAQIKKQIPRMYVSPQRNNVENQVQVAKMLNIPPWQWYPEHDSTYSLYFLDVSHWGWNCGYRKETPKPNRRLRRPTGDYYVRKRIGERWKFVVFSDDGHPKDPMVAGPFAIDLTASVWDDRRLQRWGYEFCDWLLDSYPGCCWDCASLSYGRDGGDDPELEYNEESEEEIPERFATRRYRSQEKERLAKGTKSAKGMRPKNYAKATDKHLLDGKHDELGDLMDRKLDLNL